jgi:hypothetical protein
MSMSQLRTRALSLGATEFGESKVKSKRYYVVYDKRRINFGLKGGSTFIDHNDTAKKEAWYKRHSKIKNKQGQFVIGLKTSPDFWSARLLWP